MQLLVNTNFNSQGIFKKQYSFTVNSAYIIKFGRYPMLSYRQYFTINILVLYVDHVKSELRESPLFLNVAEGYHPPWLADTHTCNLP